MHYQIRSNKLICRCLLSSALLFGILRIAWFVFSSLDYSLNTTLLASRDLGLICRIIKHDLGKVRYLREIPGKEEKSLEKTRQLLPTTKKDVLPSHHHSNVIYQFVCHCDSRYVGRTSQRLEERIKQHVPKSISDPPAAPSRQILSRSCKTNKITPRQFHESAIGQHLFDNAECARHYNCDKFSILARGRSLFHLSAF